MKKFYLTSAMQVTIWSLFFFITISQRAFGQSFSQNNINFNGKGAISNGTSLMFGPDGRLYVAEYTGQIKIFTIQRNGPSDYVVLNAEVLNGILEIEDHNDDGSLYLSTYRETLGLTVSGSSTYPVIYVTSSDFRIGAGGGGDLGLDTNSGIITRFSWTGSTWDVVDIVRGLPRSEENHATNGLEFVTVKGVDYLIVAQGGHTNAGGPSKNFAYTTEYALSAAVLSVNLTQLNSMPILTDNGRKFIYDLPTLDDPTRPNVNSIINPDDPNYDGKDVNDPWGGNDGLNQAIIVPGGPVQIFSPGYRNAYDLVVTEGGAVFVTDNGSNGGWGGFPVNEGGGNANNNYDPNEPGSTSASGGEQVNNKDHLTMVTMDIQNYVFGSFYGGHPTPVRANPTGAGLYTNPAETGTVGAIFRTLIYHPNNTSNGFTNDPNKGLPANWPPVPYANSVEGDWRGPDLSNPDGPVDELVTTWGTNTNGIDEYTASNFEGAMKGNLIAGVNTGELRRVELHPDGSLLKLTSSFASGIGGDALGITCNSDSDIFPGSIWVVTLNGNLVVLEPQDFIECAEPGSVGYDPIADSDFDGYTNQDEIDNGTDPCNGGSQPNDHDKAAGAPLISNLNDPDDDNDGIPDAEDPFQLGDPLKNGSDAFIIPILNDLFSSNPDLKGYLGLGLTGLMNNGEQGANWLNWLDRRDDPSDPNPNDILGGAIGAMTMQMTSGTALGNSNSQEKGFQYGILANAASGNFVVKGGIMNFNSPLQLYGNSSAPNGELGFFIGDGSQSNYIKFVLKPSGIFVQQELNDNPEEPINLNIPFEERPESGVLFYFNVYPSTGEIILQYSLDNGSPITLGNLFAKGAILDAIQLSAKDLAVGMIGTSNANGVEVEGTWDFLNVTGSGPYIVKKLADIEQFIGAIEDTFNLDEYFGDDKGVENLKYSVTNNSNQNIQSTISGSLLSIIYPESSAESLITIRATDAEGKYVDQTFTVSVLEVSKSFVLYRINAGGPSITSIDGEIDWGADSSLENSSYLAVSGTNTGSEFPINGYDPSVDQSTTPLTIFGSERYDATAGPPNLTYSFPVDQGGRYEVRLYFANGYSGTATAGSRIFNVAVEGVVPPQLNNIDLIALFGHQTGGKISHFVDVHDGILDISFIHVVENPLINGIEILKAGDAGTPIEVVQVENQVNEEGDSLNGSLVVQASGGDGNLVYSMMGAPQGIVIEPTNGQIGGTIAAGASNLSPYTVHVKVDDGDEFDDDAVTLSFSWTVTTGEPFITGTLPDIIRATSDENDIINLNEYFNDDKGLENLTYTIEENTNSQIAVVITGDVLIISYPTAAAVTNITLRATDSDALFVDQTFKVTVSDKSESLVLYRINAGGPLISAIDGDINWGADGTGTNSPYLAVSGSNTASGFTMTGYDQGVDQSSIPIAIYGSERYDDNPSPPNMTYSFPVDQVGRYEVRLFVGNGFDGTAAAGSRIFSVEVEGVVPPELNNIDLSVLFGHKIGGIISYFVEVNDGILDISFIHVVENPLINGIEILGASNKENAIQISQISNQSNFEGDILDDTLKATATGGDGTLVYSMTGAPSGVSINTVTGVINGSIGLDADLSSPYNVTITVDDSDEETADAVTTTFNWTIFSGTPVVTTILQDIERIVSSSDDIIDLNLHFNDNDGVENLSYTVSQNTDMSIGAIIVNNLLTLKYPANSTITDITIRAIDAQDNFVEQSFRVTVIYDPEGTPIEISQVEPQENTVGNVLDGSLAIIATGGDGALVYSITGAPLGVIINSTTGILSGTIAMDADVSSPYNVLVTVDDSDEVTTDAVSINFTWTILSEDPVIVAVLPDLERYVDAPNEDINLENYFDDNDGIDNLTFSVISTNTAVGAVANGKNLTLNYPSVEAVSNITVRATDSNSNFVEQTFSVTVINIPLVLHRVNAGGPLVLSIDDEKDWDADTALENSTYLVQPGTNTVSGITINSYNSVVDLTTTPSSIFNSERSDISSGVPNMTYSFPVPKAGSYLVKLYFANSSNGTSRVGSQIFNVSLEGVLYEKFTNLDLISAFGHRVGGVISQTIEVADGKLDIVFLHGTKKNPIINGIEIINASGNILPTPIQITQISNQANYEGDVLAGTLKANATGGEGALVYSMAGAPAGVVINSSTGVINGTIGMNSASASPYNVIVSVDDSDGVTNDAVSTQFTWTILNGTPVIVQNIPDIERVVGSANEEINLNNYFDDNGGVENLTYTVHLNTNPVIGALISGNMLLVSFPNEPAISDITIRATDANEKFVQQTFKVTVIETSGQTPIEVAQIFNQSNFSGDVLDGSLAVNATGGDGALVYNIGNAPAGVLINSANGVISGTISQEAHLLSPYNVSVTVEDSDEFSNDAVTVNFSWKVDQVQVVYQGCTAEFWAGSSSWCSTYKSTDSFFTVFGITNKRGLGGKSGSLTLQEALNSKGAGYNKLAKQATAALLNACTASVNYQYPEIQIKSEVQVAFNNSAYSNSYANTLSSKFETANNAGCPVSNLSSLTSKAYETTGKEAKNNPAEDELEIEETITIKLYPNPANAEVYLQTPNPSVEISEVAFYDYSGRYIRTLSIGQDLIFEGNERYTFNVMGIPNEVYILKISTKSSGVFNLRLIKED